MSEKIFSLENTCIKKGCLDGEVAVVTGATSNVGRGYAQALAWAGAKVVVVGRNEQRGGQVVEETMVRTLRYSLKQMYLLLKI